MKIGEYTIRWRHNNDASDAPLYTQCNMEGAGLAAEAIAFCHPEDNFCKDTGRKISLSRCMHAMELSKEERATIWEAYRKTKPDGRW